MSLMMMLMMVPMMMIVMMKSGRIEMRNGLWNDGYGPKNHYFYHRNGSGGIDLVILMLADLIMIDSNCDCYWIIV